MDISDFGLDDDDVKDGDFTQEDADQVEAENAAQDRVEGFAPVDEPADEIPVGEAAAAADPLPEAEEVADPEEEEEVVTAPAGRAVPSAAEDDEEDISLDTRPIQIRKRRREPIPPDGIPAGTRVGVESDGVFGKKKAKKKKKPRKARAGAADEADEAEEEEEEGPPPPVNYQSVWPDTRIYPAPTSSFNYFARSRCEDDDNPNSMHRQVERMANDIHMYSPHDMVKIFQKAYRLNVTGEGKTPLLKETDPARIKEGLYHRWVTPLAITNQFVKTNFYTWLCGMESGGYVADDQGRILGVSEAAAKLTKQAVDNHVKLAKLLKT